MNAVKHTLTIDLGNVSDTEKIKKVLKQKADEFMTKWGESAKFVDETAYVTIKSSKVNANMVLIDMPGFVEVDPEDPENKARQQIIDIIKKYREQRRTLILCCHKATQNIDNCAPLRFLKYSAFKQINVPLFEVLFIYIYSAEGGFIL